MGSELRCRRFRFNSSKRADKQDEWRICLELKFDYHILYGRRMSNLSPREFSYELLGQLGDVTVDNFSMDN